MRYKIESIGAEFSKGALPKLEEHFSKRDQEGYEFHSVFQVVEKGCLGLGQGKVTYLAVFKRKE